MLTKEAILGAQDLRIERVEIPEWGGHAFHRVLSIAERVEMEARNDNATVDDVLANVVGYALCDESGTRLFSNDDLPALKAKNAAVMLRLSDICRKHNTLTRKDVEEIAKNSVAAPSDASSSNSPNGSGARSESLSSV